MNTKDFPDFASLRANSEAFEFYRSRKRSTVINWNDIAVSVSCYPEHESAARSITRSYLGYDVADSIALPHIGFIQTLIQNYVSGQKEHEIFCTEVVQTIKQIRNDDMQKGGWISAKPYSEKHYADYNHINVEHKEKARHRICALLGYVPIVDYSLEAEIMLRHIFTIDPEYEYKDFGASDYKAGTIVQYREIALTKGIDAANELDLLTMG
jgi:hypothetical protein